MLKIERIVCEISALQRMCSKVINGWQKRNLELDQARDNAMPFF